LAKNKVFDGENFPLVYTLILVIYAALAITYFCIVAKLQNVIGFFMMTQTTYISFSSSIAAKLHNF
jgi:hypothetical protein